jgi:hypothetical protein
MKHSEASLYVWLAVVLEVQVYEGRKNKKTFPSAVNAAHIYRPGIQSSAITSELLTMNHEPSTMNY